MEANIKVIEMMNDIKENVKNWDNEREIEDYLVKILRKEAFDRKGLLYGIGHAVYTLSDPRELLLKERPVNFRRRKICRKNTGYTNLSKISSPGAGRGKEDYQAYCCQR